MSTPRHTGDTIGKAAGLIPFDEFAYQQRQRTGEERRVGRTTQMLCWAVARAARGETVLIVGHNPGYSGRLRELALGIAARAGADVGRRIIPPCPEWRTMRLLNKITVAYDHHRADVAQV